MSLMPVPPTNPETKEALDISEKGAPKNGVRQTLNRRLFFQLTVFGGADAAVEQGLARALEAAPVEAVLYRESGDPRGLGVLAMGEDPAVFTESLRKALHSFPALILKPEFMMLGRTYALGYEPNLEDWLLQRPRRVALDPQSAWAVWYPLRRTGAFTQLPHQEQMSILREHSQIGRSFGDADLAHDVRLACHGLDKNDNDFVIGLIGKELYPLSALVQAMRPTRQTSSFIQNMGPFFIGRAVWRSRQP